MRPPATPSNPTASGHPTAARYPAAHSYLQPPVSQQPSELSDTPKSQVKDRDRDLSECERESAFAGPGEKRRVFDKCMKARGY